jgi:hypothetical protein
MHAITAGGEHRERGIQILAFEIAIEGISEEDDVARFVTSPLVGEVGERSETGGG